MYKMWANIPFEVASEFILEWRITVNIPLPENIFSFFLLALCKKKKRPGKHSQESNMFSNCHTLHEGEAQVE